jgi:hypothetical protein
MSASFGFRWWQYMNVRGLQDDCTAAEVICSAILTPRIPLCPTYRNISKLCRRDVRSNSCLLRQSVRFKNRLLNVLNLIQHGSFFFLDQLYVAFYRSSSFGKVTSAIFEWHRQGTENDCFIIPSLAHREVDYSFKYTQNKLSLIKYFTLCTYDG